MEGVDERRHFSARLVDRQWLAPGILELRLSRPAGFSFIPGQFVRVVMDGYARDYTMVSGPAAETLDFCIAVVDGGRFSSDIQKANIEAPLQLTGPHGHFVYQGMGNPAVFVSTGTGVAPFVAFCRSGVANARLLHGVSTPDRLIYRDVLQSGLREYVPCISRSGENMNGLDHSCPGRVTQYIENYLNPATYDFYLCGRGGMIRDVTALIDARFGDSRLFIETYD